MEEPPEELAVRWDAHPLRKRNRTTNEIVEYFMVGDLARALHRTVHTIYKWERSGFLPKARYGKKVDGALGGASRRLYTRRQIEGLVLIATEEGLIGHKISLKDTNFARRARTLFEKGVVQP